MSNDFTALRARARERRDKIINQAKADYEAALKQIAALEQDLLGVRRPRKSNGPRRPSTSGVAWNCRKRLGAI